MGCYDKAVALLAGRPHFRRQLFAKLAARGYPEDEIEPALDRLTAQGYLDDLRTARDWVAARREKGTEGRVRLEAELARRGAPAEAVAAALADLPDDDEPAAREAARKWSARGRQDPAALARHLARKGFSRRAIVAVLRERPGAEGAELDDFE